jgi:hypothetical protein
MSQLTNLKFDLKQFNKELQEFHTLLSSQRELSERSEILPFFKARPFLSLGISWLGNVLPEIYAHEFNLWGKFQSDLVVGSTSKRHFFFVEFEDATKDSIFKKINQKSTSEFSRRFEHGYSQIIDWFYLLNDVSKTRQFETAFGHNSIKYDGILVVGRSHFLNEKYDETQRLSWRMNHVIVNSKKVLCYTYDELCQALMEMVEQMSVP